VRPPRSRRVLRLLWVSHRFWWRISDGRIGARAAGLPVLELITRGRRSGRPRSVLLNFVSHRDGFVVVASNAGSEQPPAWWLNLQGEPTALVRRDGREYQARARELFGDERDDLFRAFVRRNRAYARYAETAGRPIPVVLLQVVMTAMDRSPAGLVPEPA
jgi:deazaflavin-dependent oxidoreductase (nitroreductase family)